ncbi:unnamed protein product [Owenia fusiformis]|uniref:Uncharacterized protein n=1 Tax=Owenia fusiformis TaxID=6347 RepID=A0A8J1Y9E9_OWEFU|nr:unnamed protein product [Owenia fusiformis]
MATKVQKNLSMSLSDMPGLHTVKAPKTKLLRKPRAPPPKSKIPTPPPPEKFYIEAEPKVLPHQRSPYLNQTNSSLKNNVSPVPSIEHPSMVTPPPSEAGHDYINHIEPGDDIALAHSQSIDIEEYRLMSRLTSQPSPVSNSLLKSATQKQVSKFNKDDKKYVLDANYRESTFDVNGLQEDGIKTKQSSVKPYKPRGPDGLPMRMPKQPPVVSNVYLYADGPETYRPPAFTLEDFLVQMSHIHKLSLGSVKEKMLSRHNYKKLTRILADKCFKLQQTELKTVNITIKDEDIPVKVTPRVPQQQLLIEMAAVIKEQFKNIMKSEVKTVIRPLPKYSPPYIPGTAPHTEIILYEDDGTVLREKSLQMIRDSTMPTKDAVFQSADSRHFQGSRRSNSPFATNEEQISPAELSVLDCLVSGATALSLKAHFISEIPDIQPVSRTLRYLNLSFNDFSEIPEVVFSLHRLEILKLRNNPIEEIPPAISGLKRLRSLVISFCMLSSVPVSLFQCEKLRHLDLSYNRLTFLPQEMENANRLREMNLEGNQLSSMPYGALRLPRLKYLRVTNNYMHPLFWKEHTKNAPQRLSDLAALCFTQSGRRARYKTIPDEAEKLLSKASQCNCCNGPIYGPGLRIIRPISKIFSVKNLPFLFRACSPFCRDVFMDSGETLQEILYGQSDTQIVNTQSPSESPRESSRQNDANSTPQSIISGPIGIQQDFALQKQNVAVT